MDALVRGLRIIQIGESLTPQLDSDLVFNIDGLNPQPQVSWILDGAIFRSDLADRIAIDLGARIDPWVIGFLKKTRAENIAMGITQAGKTFDAQAFFELPIALNPMFPDKKVSMLGVLFTGSLTLIPALIDYYIANPSTFDNLTPFVSAERLTSWKNEVLGFLTGGQ